MNLRLMGTVLIAVCSVLLGNQASLGLSLRVKALETALLFWRGVKNQLQFTRASPQWIFADLQRQDSRWQSLDFVGETLSGTEGGCPFPVAFAQALAKEKSRWKPEEYEILYQAGALLGASDLQTQLEGLDYCLCRLEEALALAKEERSRHGGLYRSLGMTGAAAVLILLW